MLRKIVAIFIILFVSVGGLVTAGFDNGDTGSYEILNYACRLEPQPDSTVRLTITQKWLVTGGHIPWVSVGLPDPNFDIETFSGAAKSVRADNSGSWSGVTLTLDKDYQTGAAFEFTFTIRERDLMPNGRISYTPGWYDSAVTDTLVIQVIIPFGAGDVSYSPAPQSVDSSSITWEKRALKKGERFNIDVTFGGLVSAGAPAAPSSPVDWLNNNQFVLALILPIAILAFSAVYYIRRKQLRSNLSTPPLNLQKKHEEITLDKDGKVVKDVETDDEDKDKNKEDEYTRPAVRPVSVYHSCVARSCACVSCACVSCACACACACAGGHGAGCAKKGLLDCEKCGRKETCTSRPFINNGARPVK